MSDIYSVMSQLVDFHNNLPISSGYQAILTLDLLQGVSIRLVATSRD